MLRTLGLEKTNQATLQAMNLTTNILASLTAGLFAQSAFASPVPLTISPGSEYLDEWGIEVDCRVDNWSGDTPGSIPFTIRVKKQKPEGGRQPLSIEPVFYGTLTTFTSNEKRHAVASATFPGSEKRDLEASFRVQPKEIEKVQFSIYPLVESRILYIDLEAFLAIAIADWYVELR